MIITLNVNELNVPTKRLRLGEWIQKQDPYICCLQETRFRPRDTYRLKMRGWRKIFHANGNQKKAGIAILISDKIDFKTKTITRDKEGHYILIKGSIQVEDKTTVNIYAPSIGAPQYIWQILTAIKGESNSNTVMVGDFNTPLSPMDRSSKMKINKETQALNDTLNKIDLIYIYRTFHPKTTEYTFFSSAHGIFFRIGHILCHKSTLRKFKKIEIISSIFFFIIYILFFHFYLFIYLFMAVLGLRFCAKAFSSCGKWGPLFIAVRGPLTVVASPVAEHRLQMLRLSNCGSQA